MLGRQHAASGMAAGAAVALYGLHLPAPQALGLAGLTAAFALAPDLDQECSSAGKCLGPVSRAVAWGIGKISGGHRNGTHSLLGVAVATGLAYAGETYRYTLAGRIGLGLLLAIVLAAGVWALRLPRLLGVLGVREFWLRDLIGDAAAVAVACWLAVTGTGLGLVLAACALGCSVHILGDMLTIEGCPLLWPFSHRRFWLTPRLIRFETDHWTERRIVAPVLLVALGLLAWHAVSLPGYLHSIR